jgi:ubiquinone/menaquinone biosynthesis C-methylase UbiE
MVSNRHPTKEQSANSIPSRRAICDYEGSAYRTDFWTRDRSYEDAVERIALKALLPPSGHRIIEIGAGFGRLVDLYAGYSQVILFDYSRSMLREAQSLWGEVGPAGRPRYIYVAGDFNALPFVPGAFDTVTLVRVIHHAPDASHLLQGISEVIAPGGTFVLEFANKRNLKAVARWLLRRQKWSPFAPTPYEFVELNFNFHPRWMQNQLTQAGFTIQTLRTVSHFRLGLLKRAIPTQYLVQLDNLIQPTGRWWQLTPSVFVKSNTASNSVASTENALFCCPVCRSHDLSKQPDALACRNCARAWAIQEGLYDFKAPV